MGIKIGSSKSTSTEKYDLSWVGTKVKVATAGVCPFCGAIVNLDEPHRCPLLPEVINQLEKPLFKEFSEDILLLVGPAWTINEAVAKLEKKYPKLKFYIIYR